MELACMFDGLGTKVTVLEMLPTILAPLDDEVRKLLVRILTKTAGCLRLLPMGT
ncbi:MAG: NAD-binding protein [Ktedonobacteraceae bacterium]